MASSSRDSNAVARTAPSDTSRDPARAPIDHGRIARVMRYVRFGLIVFGVLVSTVAYLYLIDLVDPRDNFNAFSDLARMVRTDEYQFFSGSKGGFYIRVGTALERRSEDESFRFRNTTTSGGLENARRVASTAKSFGIVQEDTLSSTDFMREHIRYITPLYLERMHIIYDADALEKFRKSEAGSEASEETDSDPTTNLPGSKLPVTLSQSNGKDDEIHRFFKQARISTGPVGSGSRIFSRYLLTYCGISEYRDFGLPFSQALSRLDATGDQKVDIVFTIAGAPLDSVTKLLQSTGNQRFQLMSIDHAVIPALNDHFDLRLNRTDYQGKYQGGQAVSSFGSWAFLVASRDVSDVAISRTLEELHQAKDEIRRDMNIDDQEQFQLSEFNFYETYRLGQTGARLRMLRNILLFVVFSAVTTTAVFLSSSWFISSINKVRYYRVLTRVNERSLEDNWLLNWPDDGEEGFPEPIIHEDQKDIISKLIQGISDHSSLAVRIRQSYNNGGLLSVHRSQLLSTVEEHRSVFQHHLARRLNEYYANYGEYEAVTLRHFFTAGYLSSEQYSRLTNAYGGPQTPTDEREAAPTEERGLSPTEAPAPPNGSSTVGMIRPAPKIFISYRRNDSTFAVGRIRERLVSTFGREAIFQDVDIPAGRDFREYIEQEVGRCDILLAIIGSEWTTIMHERARGADDDYYRAELEVGLESDETTVIPVLLAPAQLPYDDELPPSIRPILYRQAVTVRPDPEFHQSTNRLIQAIIDDFAERIEPAPVPTNKRRGGRKKSGDD